MGVFVLLLLFFVVVVFVGCGGFVYVLLLLSLVFEGASVFCLGVFYFGLLLGFFLGGMRACFVLFVSCCCFCDS